MRVCANDIEIEVDDQGPAGGEPLVLVMGLGMQLLAWPDPLVQQLVARGFRVLRLDNRDAGLSTSFDHLGVPNLAAALLRHALHLPVPAPYGIADMAEDVRGVLDALGIAAAHVCGASMGGMIAQHLAARHPARVKSLTLMMTTSGARHLPQATLKLRLALLHRPPPRASEAALIEHLVRFVGLIASPGYPTPTEELRERLTTAVRRAWRPAGVQRQIAAIAADGDRSALVRTIRAPTHVIHGDRDPLVPVDAAHDLVPRITGATVDIVPGMGHDLPAALLQRFAEGIAANAARARSP